MIAVKVVHDPVVKGKGTDTYAICDACVRETFQCVSLATGSRHWVNKMVREHRRQFNR